MARINHLACLLVAFSNAGCGQPEKRHSADIFPPWTDKGFVVYLSYMGEFGDAPELWLASIDGNNRQKLPTGPRRVSAPTISPDGRTIVIGGDEGRSKDSSGLFAMNATGEVTQLTTGIFDSTPRFHKSSRFLIFQRYRDENVTDIMRLDLAGKKITPLISNGSINRYPCISPNGEKIAFVSNISGKFRLYVANIDGSAAKAILEHDDYYAPAFGQNSRELWINRPSDNEQLVCVDLSGNILRRISLDVGFSSPVALKDGSMICEVFRDNVWALMRFDQKGAILRRFTSGEHDAQRAAAWEPE